MPTTTDTFTHQEQIEALDWLIDENAHNNPQAMTTEMAETIIRTLTCCHAKLEAAEEEITRLNQHVAYIAREWRADLIRLGATVPEAEAR